MVGLIIRPSDLTTERTSPVPSEFMVVDNGVTVAKSKISDVVNSGRPVASQAEAEAGTDPSKAMTPLTTRQAINERLTSSSILSTVARTGSYADLIDAPPGLTDGDKGDITVSSAGSAWALNPGTVGDSSLVVGSKAHNRVTAYVDIRDHGAVPITSRTAGAPDQDSFAAIQAAVDYAEANGIRRLFVPFDVRGFYSSQQIVSEGPFEIFGAGMFGSRILFGGDFNWRHNGGVPQFWNTPQVYVHDMSFQSDKVGVNASTAMLHIEFDVGGNGTTGWTAIVERCGFSGSDGNLKAPATGLRLVNATNARITHNYAFGQGWKALEDISASSALVISTTSQAVDIYVFENTFDFFTNGVSLIGAAVSGVGAEGIVIADNLILGCDYGVRAITTHFLPYLVVKGNNIAAGICCVQLRNWCAYQILDNFFYIRERGDNTAWFGIDVGSSMRDYGYGNLIRGNLIDPIAFVDTPVRTGIIVSQTPSAADPEFPAVLTPTPTLLLIDGNTFGNLATGIVLAADVNGVKITDTNKYLATVTNKIVNGSVSTANVVADWFHGSTGFRVDNTGLETKFGVASVALGGSLRASVVFPVPFKSACYNVQITNNLADGTSAQAIVADSYSLTGFSIYVPGGTSGNVKQVAWVAIGK